MVKVGVVDSLDVAVTAVGTAGFAASGMVACVLLEVVREKNRDPFSSNHCVVDSLPVNWVGFILVQR